MPTYEAVPRFFREWDDLTDQQREGFRASIIDKFVPDLREIEEGRSDRFRPGLRVKSYRSKDGVLEVTLAPNGRALFLFGETLMDGKAHVVWLRVGTHDIF